MDEREEPQFPPDDDKTPTQEDAPGPNAWVMPQPVFRSSSGYLPKGFEQRYGQSDVPTEEPTVPEAAQTDGIAEQPHVTEEPEAANTASAEIAQTPPKKKRGFLRVLMMIVGIILAVGAVLAIVGVILVWYVFRASESGNLN
jgi:hypothetical protein